MRKRLITILMSFVMIMSFIPLIGGIDIVYALESTGNATLDSFINDSRFTNGASWSGSKAPLLSSFGSKGCCAYCADYVKYCYGIDNPRSGASFTNTSEIRAGDVLTVGNQSDGTGHWFICLKRSGNNLYVAEGAVSNKVRIGWNYTINGNKFSQDSRNFTAGYHYLNGSSDPGPAVDIQDTVYSIHSAINNNLVLDVADGKTTNGTNIQTQNYHGGPAQRFNIVKENGYYLIKPQCSNLALNTEGNSDQPGANVNQWESNGSHGQHWEFVDAGDGYYYIRNWRGTYLDVSGGENSIQVNIQTWSYNGSNAQKWKLVHETRSVSEGYYSFHSTKNNDLALDIANESRKEGANLQLNNYNGSRAQVFRIKKENNSYTIHPLCSGLMIDTAANSDVSGANLIQWSDTGAQGQRFKFVITGGGNYYIRSNLGRFIDITDGVFAQGTNIQSCKFNGTTAQKWKLVKEDISKFKPTMPTVTVSGSNGDAIISWNSVDTEYKNKYDVRIYDIDKGLDNYIKVAWGVDGTSYTTNLPAGSYGVTVAAVDKIDTNIFSDAKLVRFTIDENGKVEQETKPDDPDDPSAPTGTDTPAPGSDPNQMGHDGTAIGKGASAAAAEKAITTMLNDNDLPGAVYSKLRVRSPKQTTNSIQLRWKKQSNAVKYVIYGNKCGKKNKPKKLATVEDKNTKTINKTFRKVLGKKVRKGTYYKFIVVALDKDNNVVSTSKMIHVATKGGKYCNFKSVTVRKAVINKAKNLRKGKTLKLNAKAVKQSGKLKVSVHRDLKYESSNNKIATVSKNGKVTAKRKGSCYIYAYTQNGAYKRIIIIVQ